MGRERYEVKLAGIRLGTEEWALWDNKNSDYVRDPYGLVIVIGNSKVEAEASKERFRGQGLLHGENIGHQLARVLYPGLYGRGAQFPHSTSEKGLHHSPIERLRGKFSLGQNVMTRGVADKVAVDIKFSEFVFKSLKRHASGDWGDMCEDDKKANENALKVGERLFSAYEHAGRKVWIITEADRSATTILFPEEY